jgi:hypothetical protein
MTKPNTSTALRAREVLRSFLVAEYGRHTLYYTVLRKTPNHHIVRLFILSSDTLGRPQATSLPTQLVGASALVRRGCDGCSIYVKRSGAGEVADLNTLAVIIGCAVGTETPAMRRLQ